MCFPPTLSACLYIEENQRIIWRQFLPSKINWMWICYFNTNDTTYRRNSAMKSNGGDLTGLCCSGVLWDLLLEAEVRVEIGYLKNAVHRNLIFKEDQLSVSSWSFDTSFQKSIKIWRLLLTFQDSLWICDPLGPLVYLMKVLNFKHT